jgi:hypothetical protein
MITQNTSTTQNFLARQGLATPVNFSPISAPPIISSDPFVALVIVDEEYENWKHEMGLDVSLSEQQVIDCYTYELAVL